MRKAVVAGLGAFALSISALVLATGASSKPAKGETLQAACCDELDERVAELSRATALKRIDNHTSLCRFGLVGQGTIKPGLAVSYRQEIDAPFPFSDEIFNAADGHTGIASAAKQLRVRQHYWTLAAKEFGGFSLGYQSPANDVAAIINLGNQLNDTAVHDNNAFRIPVGPACDFLTATVCCGDSANTSNLPAGAWQGLVIGARMQFWNGRSSRTTWPNANTGDA